MANVDKEELLKRLENLDQVEIELGCGSQKKIDKAIGIDAIAYKSVDIVGDVFNVLRMFPPASVDAVHSFHFFEHIDDIQSLLDEISRVMKVGASLHIIVPHFSNPHFYSDPTHKNFFGLYTFSYFAMDSPFSRKVPMYGYSSNFSIKQVDLCFKSSRPFYFRYLFKKLCGFVFNSCNYMKEFYEENLCYFLPCYEVSYKLIKIPK